MATSVTAFIGQAPRGLVDEPVLLTSMADFVEVFGEPSPQLALGQAVSDFYRHGGTVAVVVRITGEPDAAAYARALDALRRVTFANLLVVPGDLPPDTVAALAAFAEERRAFFLMDPPSAWTSVEAALEGAAAPAFVRSPNLAVYFPRIRQPGPPRAASGAVAGVIARNDTTRGVWKAPAGVEADLDGVTELDLAVDDADSGRLNLLGVNCLRTFPGTGPVIWGARTTEVSDPEWKYVSVRRLAVFLEGSIDRGTKWAVFEPNDEALWGRIRTEVGAFLDGLFRRGAFCGSSARDAYFVRCDGGTTSQADIDDGVVNLEVGFAALRPAEFVTLRLRQAAGGDRTAPVPR